MCMSECSQSDHPQEILQVAERVPLSLIHSFSFALLTIGYSKCFVVSENRVFRFLSLKSAIYSPTAVVDRFCCAILPLPPSPAVTSYMYKFGHSDPLQDPGLESRISRKVAEFFQAQWRKRETAQGPYDRSKTVSYVHKYSQPTNNGAGAPIQHNTCVQQTCVVRLVRLAAPLAHAWHVFGRV